MGETQKIWARYPEWARIAAAVLAWCVVGAVLWGIAKTDVMSVFTNLWTVGGLVLLGAAVTILVPRKKEN